MEGAVSKFAFRHPWMSVLGSLVIAVVVIVGYGFIVDHFPQVLVIPSMGVLLGMALAGLLGMP